MPEFMTFSEIADKLGVGIDTVRRTVKRLKLPIQKEKTPTSKGSIVYCLGIDDANALISYFENRGAPALGDSTDETGLQRFGYLYIIQLVPEAIPNRVKVGYTDNLDTRLREHQTAAPTAKYLGHWRCKRAWDQAAMDCVTREGCHLVMNEVYEGDVESFVKRAEVFFSIMPKNPNPPELSEHSPLRKRKQKF